MNEQTVIHAALQDSLMHSILLSGPDKARCVSLGTRVAASYLFGTDDPTRLNRCPDYIELNPPHTVDGMRELIAMLSNRSFSDSEKERSSALWDTAGRRCVLIADAHTLNPNSQNALLKVLEEPPERVLFILIGVEAALLPTIRSRSAVIRLGVPSVDETAKELEQDGIEPNLARSASVWSDGLKSDAVLFACEAYAAFRKEACEVFIDALNGKPVYTASAALLKHDFRAEQDTGAKEKAAKADAFLAPFVLDIWQSLTRDMTVQKLFNGTDKVKLRCPEQCSVTAECARHFTFSQLECIIERLDSGIARLSGGASPAQTVDLMLTGLPRKEN